MITIVGLKIFSSILSINIVTINSKVILRMVNQYIAWKYILLVKITT